MPQISIDDLHPDLANHIITVSRGADSKSQNWTPYQYTIGEWLAENFQTVKVGPKDGLSFTQGHIRFDKRLKGNVAHNDVMMFDVDCGHSLEEVVAIFEPTGALVAIMPTHSHLKTESEIGEASLDRFCTKHGYEKGSLEGATEYLRQEKGVVESILQTITDVTTEHRPGGVQYVVQHGPMPRFRAVLFLAEPYQFTGRPGVSHADAMKEWSEGYLALAQSIGLTIDKKTADPSRLMYAPRRPIGTDPSEWTLTLLDGGLVYWEDVRACINNVVDPLANAAARLGGGAATSTTFQTPGLLQFLAKGGKSFHAAAWMEHNFGEPRRIDGEKLTFQCPLDDMHSNPGDPADVGFFVTNADADGDGGPWTMYCSHATCSAHTSGDRGKYLDAACVAAGVTDARELLSFCPDHEEEGLAHELAREVVEGDLDAAIAALQAPVPDARVAALVSAIAKAGGLLTTIERRADALADAIGARKPAVRKMVRDAVVGEVAHAGAPNAVPEPHPVPTDPARATVVWKDWAHRDQVRVAQAVLMAANEKEPHIFRKPEGGTVRIDRGSRKVNFVPLENMHQWGTEFTLYGPEFKSIGLTGEVSHAPFGNVVSATLGDVGLPWPIVETVSRVPVFAPDGTLLTTEGYHPAALMYLYPNGEFLEVPEVVGPDDVEVAKEWLDAALQDFPFSDCFDGADPMPVRHEDDATNWERGVSSRAHATAMLLQPFMRPLINGPTPLYFIDKPEKGTGANLLADVLGHMLYGTKMPGQTAAEREEELDKSITAALYGGAPTIFLDNLNHDLSSAALASALTAGVWHGRLLGQTKMLEIDVKALWLLAANNGAISEELMRRVVPIRLDAACADPALDRPESFYNIPDLLGWLKDHRQQMVWSAHVLIRNYLQALEAGEVDEAAVPPLQSFYSWSKVMGGCLQAAGIPGFLENVRAYLGSNKREEKADFEVYLGHLMVVTDGKPFTLGDALEALKPALSGVGGRPDPRFGIVFKGHPEDEGSQRQQLGQMFSKSKGRVFNLPDGRRVQVVKLPKNGKVGTQYQLVNVGVSTTDARARFVAHHGLSPD